MFCSKATSKLGHLDALKILESHLFLVKLVSFQDMASRPLRIFTFTPSPPTPPVASRRLDAPVSRRGPGAIRCQVFSITNTVKRKHPM